MYANALTCPDLQSLEKKFDAVTFYLDTPVVLNVLGLQGKGPKQAADELITLVRDLRGSIAVFEHTLEEIKGVMRYAIQHIDDPRAPSTRILRELRSNGITLSDLVLCHDQLKERLSLHHIRVKPTPPYKKTLQIDEKTFSSALEYEVYYPGEQALRNDINSVRSIYVLRSSAEPTRLEDSIAVFVTTNIPFARVAFDFGKSHNSTREVSSVITDYSLANVAWLKAPMARPSLPEKETLALCYAALEPSKELFRKYVETMNSLKENNQISEEDHAILRLSPIAHRELVDFTLGDEEALTGASMRQILARVKEGLVEEQKNALANERAKTEELQVNMTRSYEEKERSFKTVFEQAEQEKNRLSMGLLTTSKRARFLARCLTILLITSFLLVLLLGAAAGSGLLTKKLLGRSFITLVGIAVIWGCYSWYSGTSLREFREQVEHRITLKLFSWLTGEATPPER